MSINLHDGYLEYPYKIDSAKMLTITFDDSKVNYVYCLDADLDWVIQEFDQYPCEIKYNDVSLRAMDEDALLRICYPMSGSNQINNASFIFKARFSGEKQEVIVYN